MTENPATMGRIGYELPILHACIDQPDWPRPPVSLTRKPHAAQTHARTDYLRVQRPFAQDVREADTNPTDVGLLNWAFDVG